VKKWLIAGVICAILAPLVIALTMGIILMGVSKGVTAASCMPESTVVDPVRGDAPESAELFEAIEHNTEGNSRLALSMLVASYLESGWQNVKSNDGAFGYFQIQQPGVVHPDITVEEAMTAAGSTNFMLPAFKAALNYVGTLTWAVSPEKAAHDVAYAAERPAKPYYQSQGPEKVAAAYQASVQVMQERGMSVDFANDTVFDVAPPVNPISYEEMIEFCDQYGGVDYGAGLPYGQAVNVVLSAARSQFGVPYVYGGGGPQGPSTSPVAKGNFSDIGFDCSGLTSYAFAQAGINLTRTAGTQWEETRAIKEIPAGSEKPGDLVFFVSVGTTADPGHVGIVLDPSRKKMIEAPTTGDVVREGSYDRADVIGFTRPYTEEQYDLTDGVTQAGWGLPMAPGYRMSSPFGNRFHPIFHVWRLHSGVDLAAPKGTPIYAVHAGKVERAGANGGCGNTVTLRHDLRVETEYCHMTGFAPGLMIGRQVQAGQLIGFVGDTGDAVGDHLHFIVRVGGTFVDPVAYFRQNIGLELVP
jgi:Membrane proteins related to metalloendopeptidases